MVYKDVLEDQMEKLQQLSTINMDKNDTLDRKVAMAINLSEQINKTVEVLKML